MRARILSMFLLASVCVASAVAQDRTQEIRVLAERTQQIAPGVFKWSGNVVASLGTLTIRADSLEARIGGDPKTSVVVAEGNVVLERVGERLQLKRLQLDLASGRGTFELQP